MTIRQELIRNELMYLFSIAPEAMFGIKPLADRLADQASKAEISTAVDWLLENQYIKTRGRYTFGMGKGLQRYSNEKHDPFALRSNKDDWEVEVDLDVTALSDRQTRTVKAVGLESSPNPDIMPPGYKDSSYPSTKRKAPISTRTEPASLEEMVDQDEWSDMEVALNDFETLIVGKKAGIGRLQTKRRLLNRLAAIIDDSDISILLVDICCDLEDMAA